MQLKIVAEGHEDYNSAKKYLKELESTASRLSSLLRKQQNQTALGFLRQANSLRHLSSEGDYLDLEGRADNLAIAAAFANEQIPSIHKSKGKNWIRNIAIRQLAKEYKECTGHGAAVWMNRDLGKNSAFLDIVNECLCEMNFAPLSDRQLQRVLDTKKTG